MVLGNHLQPFIITYHKKTLPIKTLPMNSWVKSEFVMPLHFTSYNFCYKKWNYVDQFWREL